MTRGSSVKEHQRNPLEVGGSSPSPATNPYEPKRRFTGFEFRWREPLGRLECPFIIRWVITVFGFSLRLHHWLGSDDQRFYHDHPWDFVAMLIKGSYVEHTQKETVIRYQWEIRRYKAEYQHKVFLDCGPCWSVVFSWPKRRNFGYWVNGHVMRPFRYFSRYGIHPCD